MQELILPWSRLMEMSKEELLELYKANKEDGKMVFFKGLGRYDGYWKLDCKGDITLIGKELD